MDNYFKSSLKVLIDYFTAVLIFMLFTVPLYYHLQILSAIIFLLMFSIIYVDLNKLAAKEKRPIYNYNAKPYRGLILGIIGFSPLLIIILVCPIISINTSLLNVDVFKHSMLNALMSPLFVFIKIGKESMAAYLIAWTTVPLTAMLGYLSGYYGFEIRAYYKKIFKIKPANFRKINL
jgi:hypothetical protein